MNLRSIRIERLAVAFLLLVIGGCCVVMAYSSLRLERANDHRRAKLVLLEGYLVDPSDAPPGRIADLDGLLECSVLRVDTEYGPMLEFAGDKDVAR